jgi:tryptophanyl-tRNA synthetase
MQAFNRALSGMRPTGALHLGHYFGALKNWVDMQERMETFFFVADWHALTSDYADPGRIKDFSLAMIIDWVASGLDPEKSVIFQQSRLPEHAELNLILGMITPVSWLERNPTYKEQQQELAGKDLNNFGFLGYPVLQAADILLYRPRWVPVGQDQLPHLELTREIARRFNYLYGDYLPEPEAHLTEAAKCPGLDGRKMSKSYGNCIFLSDGIEEIAPKVRGMFTDQNRLRRSDPGNPDVCGLYPYHELLTDAARRAEIRQGCTTAALGCVDCKKIFLDGLAVFLAPLHERRVALLARPSAAAEILAEGNRRATVEARKTMDGVLELLNF